MLIYYSGNGRAAAVGPRNCDPENVLTHPAAGFMLTYAQCGAVNDNQTPRLAAYERRRRPGDPVVQRAQ